MGRTGDDEAILGRAARVVILEHQARAFALCINFARLDDRRGLRGRPVQAVEPDNEQVLDAPRRPPLSAPGKGHSGRRRPPEG